MAVLITVVTYSQTVILNPKRGYTTAPYVKITKIELKDTSTVLHFHTKSQPNTWISIPKGSFIQATNGNEKLYIVSTEGIPLNKKYWITESGEVDYQLIFPKIDSSVSTIDYGEDNDGGTWFIYDIQLKPELNQSPLPDDLLGNWMNNENGNWEVSFFDSLAIYKSKVWKYDQVNLDKNKGSITLSNDDFKLILAVKKDDSGSYHIGESFDKATKIVRSDVPFIPETPIDEAPYQTPVFKLDSATYSGYIYGYNDRIGAKTISVHINDILSGSQNTFLIEVSKNGYFTQKLPVYYPGTAYVRSTVNNGSIYLEPGKEVFQLLGANDSNSALFMGESANINSAMNKLDQIRNYDNKEVNEKILDFSPEDYKVYCKNAQLKDIAELDSIQQTGEISKKAYQIKKLDIEYEFASNCMPYKRRFESAYRTKNDIPRTQRNIDLELEPLKPEYYDFINSAMVNNPLAVISSSYNHFINGLKYAEVIRRSTKRFGTSDIIEELRKTNYTFTDDELNMIKTNQMIDSLNKVNNYNAFHEKYTEQISAFYLKHEQTIKDLSTKAEGKRASYAEIEKKLIENGITFDEDELELLKALKIREQMPEAKKISELHDSIKDELTQFHNTHKTFITELFAQNRQQAKMDNLKQLLNVDAGFATDVMAAQDECRSIVEEMTPASEEKLLSIQQKISVPFISEYIALCNEQTKAKIESNKNKTGFVINEIPKTEADKLFEGIMEKYKGKVVYVDFWATWCSPCRSGIERIKPLKEELANKDVVFVYITNETSPKNTWANMITDIKGEHYRVSSDEWNYLSGKFNISGIPHYTLVGKDGSVINPNLPHMDNNRIKSELEKYMTE
jgi:thiol-disulfide isomerase/thioredoxin